MSIKISAFPVVTSFVGADQVVINSKLTGAFAASTMTYTNFSAQLALLFQPLTGELTTLGALTSTTLGRNMLQKAHDAGRQTFPRFENTGTVTLRSAANMVSDIGAQPLSTNLTQLATATPSTIGFSFIQMDNLVAAAYIKGGAGLEQTLSGLTPAQTAADLLPFLITPRSKSQTAVATPLIPDINAFDLIVISLQDIDFTINVPNATPANGRRLSFRIKDNGVARRNITWNGIYRGSPPVITVINTTHYIDFVYNAEEVKWDAMNVKAIT
jgi:hypothetical protein